MKSPEMPSGRSANLKARDLLVLLQRYADVTLVVPQWRGDPANTSTKETHHFHALRVIKSFAPARRRS
jgi:hypothetical protein